MGFFNFKENKFFYIAEVVIVLIMVFFFVKLLPVVQINPLLLGLFLGLIGGLILFAIRKIFKI